MNLPEVLGQCPGSLKSGGSNASSPPLLRQPCLLFRLVHLELLHAALQDFSSHFGAVDRIVNFLIGHCCIVTEIYYFHVSCSLFLCAYSHIQGALCEYHIKQENLVALKWPNTHKITLKWSSWRGSSSTVGFVLS